MDPHLLGRLLFALLAAVHATGASPGHRRRIFECMDTDNPGMESFCAYSTLLLDASSSSVVLPASAALDRVRSWLGRLDSGKDGASLFVGPESAFSRADLRERCSSERVRALLPQLEQVSSASATTGDGGPQLSIRTNHVLSDNMFHWTRPPGACGSSILVPYGALLLGVVVVPDARFEDMLAAVENFPPPTPGKMGALLVVDAPPGNGNPFHWALKLSPLFTLRVLMQEGRLPASMSSLLQTWLDVELDASSARSSSPASASCPALSGELDGERAAGPALGRRPTWRWGCDVSLRVGGVCLSSPFDRVRIVSHPDFPSDWTRGFARAAAGMHNDVSFSFGVAGRYVRMDNVVIPGISTTYFPSPQVAQAFRAHVLHSLRPGAPQGGPRSVPEAAAHAPRALVYVRRQQSRVLVNEDEVLVMLQRVCDEFGLELRTADLGQSVPFAEQVSLFMDAALVVGVMGAGIVNMLWQPLGTGVLILHMPLIYYGGHTRAAWSVGRRATDLVGSLDVVRKRLSWVRGHLEHVQESGPGTVNSSSVEEADGLPATPQSVLDAMLPGEFGSNARMVMRAGSNAVDVPNAHLCLFGRDGAGAAEGYLAVRCGNYVPVHVDAELVDRMSVELLDGTVPRFRRVLVGKSGAAGG